MVTSFSAHCISDHRISDQKVRTVRVRVRSAVVRYALGRKVGNPNKCLLNKCRSHIAPFSRLYLVKVVVQLKLATVNKPIVLLS